MPTHSSLARLQQFTTLVILLVMAAWVAWVWPRSHGWAVAGVIGLGLGHGPLLASQLMLMRATSRGDPVPAATGRELLSAWWGELWVALRVFCWRQPFRWRAVPDAVGASVQGRQGVVFVHGFICNRGLWNPWMARLRREGRPFIAVNLEPVFASIDTYAPQVDDAVQRLTALTGRPPLVVAHSMGGLAVRTWLRHRLKTGSPLPVPQVVSIATPHAGTRIARGSTVPNGQQMQVGSEWLQALARDEAQVSAQGAAQAAWLCWHSNTDNIVFPPSTTMRTGADNRLVRGVGHVQLAFVPRVMDETLALLSD